MIQAFATDNAKQLMSVSRHNDLLTVAGSLNGSNNFTINGQAATLYNDLTFAVTNGVNITSGLNTFTGIAMSNSVGITNQTLKLLPTSPRNPTDSH